MSKIRESREPEPWMERVAAEWVGPGGQVKEGEIYDLAHLIASHAPEGSGQWVSVEEATAKIVATFGFVPPLETCDADGHVPETCDASRRNRRRIYDWLLPHIACLRSKAAPPNAKPAVAPQPANTNSLGTKDWVESQKHRSPAEKEPQ